MNTPNILHINTISGDWCDRDIVMLHACFQLFTDCIEKESLLTGHTDWNHNEDFRNAKMEMEELYAWWTQRKLNIANDTTNELDQAQYDNDNKMLIRLINVRKYLWT